MKALILSAGFGSRLMPHTSQLPKPLFTLAGKPLLAIALEKLIKFGCNHIFVNTHHLANQIHDYINKKNFSIPITILHEPEILGTGGSIASLAPLMEESENFWVVNADVVSDICLTKVEKAHKASRALATLVLHNFEAHNKVLVDSSDNIIHFHASSQAIQKNQSNGQILAFTGIQILSSKILSHFPTKGAYSSIEIFESLCSEKQIKAYIADHPYWEDTGTIDTYEKISRQWIAASAMGLEISKIKSIQISPVSGDGSDRKWFRACFATNKKNFSVIIGDHGICVLPESEKKQIKAFINIGKHLYHKKVPVPEILAWDTVSGMVAIQDLGSCHLADVVNQNLEEKKVIALYKQVIDNAVFLSKNGIQDFNPEWSYQTREYSREMILEKECRYFMKAFINDYCKIKIPFEDLACEFDYIAHQALIFSHTGLMHRDLQSKNIMLKDNKIFFIDFQSARKGPFQYDLASLLIDPYVGLSNQTQKTLMEYAINCLAIDSSNKKRDFLHSYKYCALCRNLQILGAFAFLSKIKGKKKFESYIPSGIKSLKTLTGQMDNSSFQGLANLINNLI